MQGYVTHYTKLTERKSIIEELTSSLDLDFSICNEFDKEVLENIDISIANTDPSLWLEQVNAIKPILLSNAGLDPNLSIDSIPWLQPRKLKSSEISLSLKHLSCLIEAAKKIEPSVIFEDDVLPYKNSNKSLIDILKIKNYDYCDIAGGCNLPIYKNDRSIKFNDSSIQLLMLSPPRSRNTAGYIITPEGALKLASQIFPIVLPLDWSYQHAFLKLKMKVSWAYPPIFKHGSMSNLNSSIQ